MIEIDILPASSETKGGDSALIRIGTFSYDQSENNQTVFLIDGGYAENADRIKEYLINHYNTKRIDFAIITHPDFDHISGFKKLLLDKDIAVGRTLLHDPWNHAKEIFNKTTDGRRTVKSINNRFGDTLGILSEILEVVGSKNVEPFGVVKFPDVNMWILGPTQQYYQELLYKFPGMEGEESSGPSDIYYEKEVEYNERMTHFIENPKTSPKNNSSVIILLQDTSNCPIALFTGDAGIEAINNALNAADAKGLNYKGAKLFQLPHHGSIKNIDFQTLKRINPNRIYVSAPPSKMEHPSKLVLNKIHSWGHPITHVKDESGVRFGFESAPGRPGWNPLPDFSPYATVNKLKEV